MATPGLDVMKSTTLSKSSSSYRPGIQVASGGLAYASAVSVSINATRTNTNPPSQSRLRIGQQSTTVDYPRQIFCAGRMQRIATIDDPAVIQRILAG